jgi:hypothetical protein
METLEEINIEEKIITAHEPKSGAEYFIEKNDFWAWIRKTKRNVIGPESVNLRGYTHNNPGFTIETFSQYVAMIKWNIFVEDVNNYLKELIKCLPRS